MSAFNIEAELEKQATAILFAEDAEDEVAIMDAMRFLATANHNLRAMRSRYQAEEQAFLDDTAKAFEQLQAKANHIEGVVS